MASKKFCPLVSAEEGAECIESNCGWWDNEQESCSVRSIAINLRRMRRDV